MEEIQRSGLILLTQIKVNKIIKLMMIVATATMTMAKQSKYIILKTMIQGQSE